MGSPPAAREGAAERGRGGSDAGCRSLMSQHIHPDWGTGGRGTVGPGLSPASSPERGGGLQAGGEEGLR